MTPIASRDQLRADFDSKIRRGIFKPVERFLTVDEAPDRMQDALGIVWEMFERYAVERGEIVPDAILVYSCKQRAVERHRHYVPCETGTRLACVLDPRNFLEGRLEVLRLDGALDADEDCPEGDRALMELADALAMTTPRRLNSALDLSAWFEGLAHQDRQVIAMRAEGHTLAEISEALGMKMDAVWRRLQALGEELAARAGVETPKRHRRPRGHSHVGEMALA